MPTATPTAGTALVDAVQASAELYTSYANKQAADAAASNAEKTAKQAARQLDLLTKQTQAENAAMGGSTMKWALPVAAVAVVGLFFLLKRKH